MTESRFRSMSKEEFIAQHVATCNASRARKYDPEKSGHATHSEMYSKRKCAKRYWRRLVAGKLE